MAATTTLLRETVLRIVTIPDLLIKIHGIESVGSLAFCPFHTNVRTPSLHIRHEGRRYYCYGCGVSGDSIDFIVRSSIMKGLDIDRETATTVLARIYGLDGTPEHVMGAVLGVMYEDLAKGPVSIVADVLMETTRDTFEHYARSLSLTGTREAWSCIEWAERQIDEIFDHVDETQVQEIQESVDCVLDVLRRQAAVYREIADLDRSEEIESESS